MDDNSKIWAVKTREFVNDEEVRSLVAAFESATITPSQFNHAAHMAVALSYLEILPLAAATSRMRSSLLRFTAHHGVDVYHETLTWFWMRLLGHLAANQYRDLPLWRRINLIVSRWEKAGPIEAHYSPAVLRTATARREWVAPDRAPLPF
jgi:hypothetical protein